MRRGTMLLCCSALAACGSSSDRETFHANMTSAQEIPAPTGLGNPTPTGSAVFTNNNDGSVSYTVTGSNMTVTATGVSPAVTFTGMHIHLAAAGATAGVTVPLTTPSNGSSSFTVTGTFTGATCTSGVVNCINTGNTLDTVLTAMRNGGAYLNVHTSRNPGGELRGQIQTGGL
jgi:CHRD domain-containing protein